MIRIKCDMCVSGDETLCRNGGLLSLVTNGGFTEYIAVSEKSAFKIPDDMQWELAASIPITTLTPYLAATAQGPNVKQEVAP